MLCRRKPGPLRRRLRRYAALILAAVVVCEAYFELAIKAQLRDVIIRDMRTLSVQAVNTAVDEFLSENYEIGERLVSITYSGGSVSAVTTDPSYINFVKTSITRRAQENIDAMSHSGRVSAHLGSFTGLIILAEAGPMIGFDVDSAQTVSCEFESTFSGAGVNQTLHHITLTVTVELTVCNPFRIHEPIITASTYEIAQTVIVGAVPSYNTALTY